MKKNTTFALVNELERHIEILLLSNDCVIVPDFGGFMAHHVDARYDGRDNMFLPPLRTIGFNSQLKINDSLLAQSYVEAYDISYPEALSRIAEEVAEIRQQLEGTGKYELNDIGILYLNENGNYSFEPCEAGILTPEFYGLGGFDMKPLAQMAPIATTIEMSQEAGIAPSPIAQGKKPIEKDETVKAASQPLTALYDKEEEEGNSAEFIQIKKSLLRNMAAACIAIIAFFALSTPLERPYVQKSQIDTGLLTRIMMPKDMSHSKNSEVDGEEKQEAATLQIKENVEESQELSEAKPYYSIVLASRVTKRNAATYAEHLQAKGFKDTKVLITSSNVKVIYGTYASENEAYAALNKLHGYEAFTDGWITKVKE